MSCWLGCRCVLIFHIVVGLLTPILSLDNVLSTPLHEAVFFQDRDMVQSLVDSDFADHNALNSYGCTALDLAIMTTDLDLVRSVLRMGGSPDTQEQRTNWPLKPPSIILALKSHHLMLAHAAQLNLHGLTAGILRSHPDGKSQRLTADILEIFQRESMKHETNTPKRLSSTSVDTRLQDFRDMFGEKIATTLLLLIENGALLNEVDVHGESPLIHAARLGLFSAVKVLVENGADVCHANWRGLTARLIARTQGYSSIVSALRVNQSELSCEGSMETEELHIEHGDTVDEVPILGAEESGKATSVEKKECTIRVMYSDEPLLNRTYIDTVLVKRLPMLVKARTGKQKEKSINDDWSARRIARDFGKIRSEVSNIPYGDVDINYITLSEYINSVVPLQPGDVVSDEEKNHSFSPLYWFSILNPDDPTEIDIIKQLGNAPSFLYYSPELRQAEGHERTSALSLENVSGYKYGIHQFFYGSFATGSPQHLHGPSWNYQARGTKAWWFWKPVHASYSKVPPIQGVSMQSWESDADFSCIQEKNDLMLVPEGWGHATFVLEESVGVAVEYTHDKVGAHSTLSVPSPLHLAYLK